MYSIPNFTISENTLDPINIFKIIINDAVLGYRQITFTDASLFKQKQRVNKDRNSKDLVRE